MSVFATWSHDGERASWIRRWPLRCIGLGVILLTDRPWYNLWRYRGVLWNVGCWVMSKEAPTQGIK